MDAIEHDQIQEYKANEFVVATPHRDLVMQRLVNTGATVSAKSPELGLTLIRLDDVTKATKHLRQEREAAGAGHRTVPAGPHQGLPLDGFLAELRGVFEDKFDHWAPTLGKNRLMRGIQFLPYPSGGGEGDPVPLPGETGLPPAIGSRNAGRGARVMVLDTRVHPHESLAGRYIADRDSLLRHSEKARLWWAGHATFIAGLILQRAPATQLRVESVLGTETAAADVWEVARRLVLCANSGADILNLSFGCFTIDGKPPLVLERAIGRLTPTMVVVAASGNHGDPKANDPKNKNKKQLVPHPNTPIWPAAFEEVVAVGATDGNGRPATFTPKVAWLDFLAPGVDVTSTYLEGSVRGRTGKLIEPPFVGVAQWSGTSFAAAAVSGAIAARTVPGLRTAYEALDQLRRGVSGHSSTGIEVARLPEF